jgi:hypothetical protein
VNLKAASALLVAFAPIQAKMRNSKHDAHFFVKDD